MKVKVLDLREGMILKNAVFSSGLVLMDRGQKLTEKHIESLKKYNIHEVDIVSEKEIKAIKKRMGAEEAKHEIDLQIGEVVNITDGPFKGFDGTVDSIDPVKGKIKVLVSMFGRDTSVELDDLQIKKL